MIIIRWMSFDVLNEVSEINGRLKFFICLLLIVCNLFILLSVFLEDKWFKICFRLIVVFVFSSMVIFFCGGFLFFIIVINFGLMKLWVLLIRWIDDDVGGVFFCGEWVIMMVLCFYS